MRIYYFDTDTHFTQASESIVLFDEPAEVPVENPSRLWQAVALAAPPSIAIYCAIFWALRAW